MNSSRGRGLADITLQFAVALIDRSEGLQVSKGSGGESAQCQVQKRSASSALETGKNICIYF